MSEDHWHRPLFQIRPGDLTGDTGQTAGMTRRGPKAELATFAGIGHAPALMADDQLETVCRWLARHN